MKCFTESLNTKRNYVLEQFQSQENAKSNFFYGKNEAESPVAELLHHSAVI